MELFGLQINKKVVPSTEKNIVLPTGDGEGSIDHYPSAGGHFGTYVDVEAGISGERDLITKYRAAAKNADVDMAIEDIVNAAIANLEKEKVVQINLDMIEDGVISSSIKSKIEKEFNKLMNILRFQRRADDLFRRWYIDGRIFFHKVVDTADVKAGIKDIRYIDPRRIKKIRNIYKKRDPKTKVEIIDRIEEFYLLKDREQMTSGINGTADPRMSVTTIGNTNNKEGIKLSKDAVTFVPSGLIDPDSNMVIGYLHKALKTTNQLRMMENALIIYRLARAPERRIFYIDVGNLPKLKAEQYIKDTMNRYRNKLIYDSSTGEIRDDKKHMAMQEDFWLARREGTKGTEIDTLKGGENLGQLADIEYFQRKLYESLNVPVSRLEQQSGLNFGRAAEITRDELKFAKFVLKLQRKFSLLFDDILRTQLLLKNIITEDEWEAIREDIRYIFAQDTYFEETKRQEMMAARFNLVAQIDAYVDKYLSVDFVQKEILGLSDAQAADVNKKRKKEIASGDLVPNYMDGNIVHSTSNFKE